MDPAWVAIGISIIGTVVGWFVAHNAARRGTEVALARQEERHNALAERCEEDRALLAMTKDLHDKRLATHELEIGWLKRGQPQDFAR